MAGDSPGPTRDPAAWRGAPDATRTFAGRGLGAHPRAEVAGTAAEHPPTEVAEAAAEHPATEMAGPAGSGAPPTRIVRFGPGVPGPGTAQAGSDPDADRAATIAERTWRGEPPPSPAGRGHRARRAAGWVLTVLLFAASGVVLYLRFYHPPLAVTGVVIARTTPTSCGVDVAGRISTNGGAGTISYEWLFQPDSQPPQRLTQSVTAGQRAVDVTVDLEGSGTGSAHRTVTLRVLRPGHGAASVGVTVSC